MPPRRARAPEDKAARRAAILYTAGRLFDSHAGQLDRLTMASLAREAGVAKGTLYLYFSSKEEIFLALFLDEVEAWLAELEWGLVQGPAPLAAEAAAAVVVQTLCPRTRLLNLLGLLHPVLEKNLSPQAILHFKESLWGMAAASAARIEQALPMLGPGQGLVFVRRLQALILGLDLATRPPPAVARALDSHPDLAAMRLDFGTELEQVVAALLRGWKAG